MKKILLVGLLALGCIQQSYPSAVSYNLSGGRFGDNLLAFSHAKWVSYKFDIPLLYTSFKYSDKLAMHGAYNTFDWNDTDSYDQVVKFSKFSGKRHDLLIDKEKNVLYYIPYFPHSQQDIDARHYFHFLIDWEDHGFIEALRTDIAPIEPFPALSLPADKLLVAVHVRTGSGPDRLYQGKTEEERSKSTKKFDDQKYPLRFPPLSFYSDQITRLFHLLGDKEMYVHIFTDNSQPEKITQTIKEIVNNPAINFGYRTQTNKQNVDTILEDFFGMTQFDYLIRPSSHFSVMASMIGHHEIIIYPTECKWDNGNLIITEIETYYRLQHNNIE